MTDRLVMTRSSSSTRTSTIGFGLAATSVAGVVAYGVAFYRRPFATLRETLRWWLRLSGARERTIAVRGLPIRYFIKGVGPKAIVLVHGLGDAAETWARVLPGLARTSRVIAPDLAGFGRAPFPPEGMTFSVLSRYLAGFIDALDLEEVILAGNSLGGSLAIRYAATHPGRVTRLFLLDSVAYPLERVTVFEPVDRDAARELVGISAGRHRQLPNFILDDLVRRARHPARHAYLKSAEPTDIRGDLDALVGIPTTIVWGEHDALVPRAQGEFLRDAIPGAELVVIPGAGHVPQGDAPAAVIRIIRERLAAKRDAGKGDRQRL